MWILRLRGLFHFCKFQGVQWHSGNVLALPLGSVVQTLDHMCESWYFLTYDHQFTVKNLDQLYLLVSPADKTTHRDMTSVWFNPHKWQFWRTCPKMTQAIEWEIQPQDRNGKSNLINWIILSLFCNVSNHNSGSESSLKIQIIFILFSNTNFKHDVMPIRVIWVKKN